MSFEYFSWAPRQSVAARRADIARRIHDAAKRGKPLSPVALEGKKIARTYWGTAWCDNLERYRDFAYRLERGRSYVRSGSVSDLQIGAGRVAAQVCGSSLYHVEITVETVASTAWKALQRDCAGSIGSRVDLLAGKLSDAVMARLCADGTGLFPAPAAIKFRCSCPDYAIMCKHVAATMYGVGARLDREPELLFTLRRVSLDDLVVAALSTRAVAKPKTGRVLAATGLAAMFGIELAEPASSSAAVVVRAPRKKTARATTPARPGAKRVAQPAARSTGGAPRARAAATGPVVTPAAKAVASRAAQKRIAARTAQNQVASRAAPKSRARPTSAPRRSS
jgi:uncharacterized Zn finger protein